MTARRPHVLLICIDALRYDCVNWQPQTPYFDLFNLPRRLTTPALDALAAQSVRFPRAVSHAGYTPLSLATTLTGAYARGHGVIDFQNTTCRPHVRSLPELFAAGGYRTAAVCGPEWFGSLGLSRGVQRVGQDERVVLDALAEPDDSPLFAFLHFNDVHSPYGYTFWDDAACDNRDFALFMWTHFGLQFDLAAREFVDRQGRRAGLDQWDGIVASACPADRQAERSLLLFKAYLHGIDKFDQVRLARFVNALGRSGVLDSSIVCVFADHGEIVAPRMPWVLGHGKFLTEQLQRVPLMIRAPGLRPRDVAPLAGLVDLAPTLLELAGLERRWDALDYERDGRSLIPAMESNRPAQPHYFQEGWSVRVAADRAWPTLFQRAVRTQDDRLLLAHGTELAASEYEEMSLEAAARYFVERGLGEIAYPQTCGELAGHLRAGVSRAALAAEIERAHPRFQCFDVAGDPLMRTPRVLTRSTATALERGWADEIERLTGTGNAAGLTAGTEDAILKHLGELGYVEA
ncbi:MAG: sulfatase-like hydrolase/transferase [Planctomycetia bacterium]|nr:MAG: sulfatase-like hydrolase/transferase [Planctomycetia bacterium]